ncbi:hypothetical protein H8356DRAFT_1417196 [Neocallimastix lanati (nom. inval.)]|nr:hypothetical protein H8356DRAFT_1417196 [Neocallimastix sp. JGI-2020a]
MLPYRTIEPGSFLVVSPWASIHKAPCFPHKKFLRNMVVSDIVLTVGLRSIWVSDFMLPFRLYWPHFKGELGTGEVYEKKCTRKILSNNMHAVQKGQICLYGSTYRK